MPFILSLPKQWSLHFHRRPRFGAKSADSRSIFIGSLEFQRPAKKSVDAALAGLTTQTNPPVKRPNGAPSIPPHKLGRIESGSIDKFLIEDHWYSSLDDLLEEAKSSPNNESKIEYLNGLIKRSNQAANLGAFLHEVVTEGAQHQASIRETASYLIRFYKTPEIDPQLPQSRPLLTAHKDLISAEAFQRGVGRPSNNGAIATATVPQRQARVRPILEKEPGSVQPNSIDEVRLKAHWGSMLRKQMESTPPNSEARKQIVALIQQSNQAADFRDFLEKTAESIGSYAPSIARKAAELAQKIAPQPPRQASAQAQLKEQWISHLRNELKACDQTQTAKTGYPESIDTTEYRKVVSELLQTALSHHDDDTWVANAVTTGTARLEKADPFNISQENLSAQKLKTLKERWIAFLRDEVAKLDQGQGSGIERPSGADTTEYRSALTQLLNFASTQGSEDDKWVIDAASKGIDRLKRVKPTNDGRDAHTKVEP